MGITYHRTEFVDDKQATLNIRSKAVNYGLGCFGGIRAYWSDRRRELFVFRLADHTRRLIDSCRVLGIEPPAPAEEIAELVGELLRRNDVRQDAYIRPIIFVDSDELSPTLTDVPVSLSIYWLPLGRYLGHQPIHACISSWRRVADNAIPARAKPTAAYMNSALARAEARRNGFDEAILLTERGTVSEGSAEHIFMVRRGQLVVPPSTEDNLDGITRASLIDLAREIRVPGREGVVVAERPISRTELYVADEILFCGTGAEVTPVVSIDRRPIADGKVGPITQALSERHARIVRGEVPEHEAWLTAVWQGRTSRVVRPDRVAPSKDSPSVGVVSVGARVTKLAPANGRRPAVPVKRGKSSRRA